MRRIWIILLVVVLLTACVAENNPPAQTTGGDTTTDAGTTGPFDGIIEEGDVIVFNHPTNVVNGEREPVGSVSVTQEEFVREFPLNYTGLSETAEYFLCYRWDIDAVKIDFTCLEYGRIAIPYGDGKLGIQYNLYVSRDQFYAEDGFHIPDPVASQISGCSVMMVEYSFPNYPEDTEHFCEAMIQDFYFSYYFSDCTQTEVVRLMKDFIARNQTAGFDSNDEDGTTRPPVDSSAKKEWRIYSSLFSNLEWYEKWLADGTLPYLTDKDKQIWSRIQLTDEFITYEMLSDIAVYHTMGFRSSESVNGDYELYFDDYHYGLEDPFGNAISLCIDQSENAIHNRDASNAIVAEGLPMTDMRKIGEKEKDILIRHHGIEYFYQKGELQNISWMYRETRFYLSISRMKQAGCVISFENPLCTYPTEGGSAFVTALLDSGTAEETISQFNAKLDKALAK